MQQALRPYVPQPRSSNCTEYDASQLADANECARFNTRKYPEQQLSLDLTSVAAELLPNLF